MPFRRDSLARFLTSLMTLVSTKYMVFFVLVLEPLEVLILPYIRHGGQDFGKTLLGRQEQRFFKKSTVFGLSTPPMSGRTLLERVDDALIKMPDNEVGHSAPLSRVLNDCNDSYTYSCVIYRMGRSNASSQSVSGLVKDGGGGGGR